MRNCIFILIFITLVISCKPSNEEEEKIPDNIISEEQFTKLLADAYLAESASGINIKNVSAQKFDSTYLFNPMKDNDISKSKFDSSMIYYTSHPKKLKLIYDQVLEKLIQFQVTIDIERDLNSKK